MGQQVHIWGRVGANGDTIEVAGWEEADPFISPISAPGVVSRVGEQVIFTSSDNGIVYNVPDAPADLEDGVEVYLFAWTARDLGQEYLVLNWENIEKVVDYPEEFIEEPIVAEPEIIGEDGIYEPFTYESFTVNEVSLAYYTSYSWPTDEEGELRYKGQPTVIIQPTWNFSGETNSGDFVEFFIQATEAQYLDR
ncbi:MAG: hypothetical protein GY805_18525 [Chloroflexi bacterium]|nr:hypothetical protein [Chloroflexota bacterium]